MKFIGNAQEIGTQIINLFKEGNLVEPLKQTFFMQDVFPSATYSFGNKLIIAMTGMLRGTSYSGAGGFKTWESMNRHVMKGQKAIYILAPMMGKRTEEDVKTGEKKVIPVIFGFKTIPVFGYEQTDGEELQGLEDKEEFIKNLPFIEVAKAWGVNVAVDVHGKGYGYYASNGTGYKKIGLGVKNLSTWAHEMCHVGDEKINGQLVKYQDSVQESVAELGGAILLSMIGDTHGADIGGCYEYIKHYAGGDNDKAIQLALNVLDRTCSVVNLIIETAKDLSLVEV